MADKVEAWKTADGRLFHTQVQADAWESAKQKVNDTEALFEAKQDEIIAHIKTRPEGYPFEHWEYDDIPVEDINPTYEEHGWECENPKNPIGLCIYDWGNSDEWCVYCGQPEERK